MKKKSLERGRACVGNRMLKELLQWMSQVAAWWLMWLVGKNDLLEYTSLRSLSHQVIHSSS